ncbi:MAG: hypothetical protein F6K21_23520 [Symploca sp. SIO2D2]|nr:hypothetical protein [Symploca sp. SIO2D2]
MPQYSVEEVLDIIKALSAEEKRILQAQLSTVLETSSSTTPQSMNTQSQSQTFGNVTASGSASVAIDQVASGGNAQLEKSNTQIKAESENIKEALQLLQQLQQDINTSSELNELQKGEAKAKIDFLQKELQEDKPNKNLINQAMAGLKNVLQGLSLLEPIQQVASLVSLAWIG